MKQKRTGHTQGNNLMESRNKAARIETKRQQIDLTEALLQTHEAMPIDKRSHEYELHLRAKLRQARNQLTAMGHDVMKMEDF